MLTMLLLDPAVELKLNFSGLVIPFVVNQTRLVLPERGVLV